MRKKGHVQPVSFWHSKSGHALATIASLGILSTRRKSVSKVKRSAYGYITSHTQLSLLQNALFCMIAISVTLEE